ncbi:MAG: hypothetical protein IPM66_07800 [Acidobacteriota bacterium]|nr:MAG: hypothetical protein IPM66_07800 [Acidobacteriota bacterium]
MQHGITEQEWNDYLDGTASIELRTRIEAHLIGCIHCWEFYEQMANVSKLLHEAGNEARGSLTLEDRRLHVMLRGVFASLRASAGEEVTQEKVQQWIDSLETMLAPICGAQAAALALQTAAKYSPARTIERVRPDNWEPFLDRLSSIAAAMCGDTFASLVQERGQM